MKKSTTKKGITKVNKEDVLKSKINILANNLKDLKNSMTKDGWTNLIAGLGGSFDKSANTYFTSSEFLDDQQLAELYTYDGYARKIISAPADDMTREWITIENDEDNAIDNKLMDLDAENAFNQALRWKRCFGGSIIIIGAMDGQELSEPLALNSIKDIEFLRPLERSEINIGTSKLNEDPTSPRFGQIEVYSTYQGVMNKIVDVHYTRVLEFKGVKVPGKLNSSDIDRRYWGVSVLQAIWERLKDLNIGISGVTNLLYEFVIGKYTIEGLAEKLANGEETLVINRMNIIQMSKSIINAVLLDSTEDFKRDSANVSGLADLLDRLMMFLSGVANIPVTRLFGRSAAGMNATGEGDERVYYDDIKSSQGTDLQKPLQSLVDLIAFHFNGNKEVSEDQKPVIIFNPLFQMTEKEKAELNKTNAETEKIKSETFANYSNLGVISEEEIRETLEENNMIQGISED